MSPGEARTSFRVSFAKVVEYQSRGSVHLHAVFRIDVLTSDDRLTELDSIMFGKLISSVARRIAVPCPEAVGGTARFGEQIDVRPLPESDERTRRRIAGYLAKYATKSSDADGLLDRKVKSLRDLRRRGLSPHLHRMAASSWGLEVRSGCRDLGLRRSTHALGFRGHWLTKSRAWSTTFAALRAERMEWKARQVDDALEGGTSHDDVMLIRSWSYFNHGWESQGEGELAAWRQRSVAKARELHREALEASLKGRI
jgi:hypothetical protein